mgnify:FL=1
MPKAFKQMFFEKSILAAKAEAEKKQKDKENTRPTRSQTKISLGKKRQEAKKARFGGSHTKKGAHGKR